MLVSKEQIYLFLKSLGKFDKFNKWTKLPTLAICILKEFECGQFVKSWLVNLIFLFYVILFLNKQNNLYFRKANKCVQKLVYCSWYGNSNFYFILFILFCKSRIEFVLCFEKKY